MKIQKRSLHPTLCSQVLGEQEKIKKTPNKLKCLSGGAPFLCHRNMIENLGYSNTNQPFVFFVMEIMKIEFAQISAFTQQHPHHEVVGVCAISRSTQQHTLFVSLLSTLSVTHVANTLGSWKIFVSLLDLKPEIHVSNCV